MLLYQSLFKIYYIIECCFTTFFESLHNFPRQGVLYYHMKL